MAAMELLSGAHLKNFSKIESLILEAELFVRVCEEIEKTFKIDYQNYFRTMKFSAEMENAMIDSNFIRCLIKDIVETEAYTISGIALYTQIPEEVIFDLIANCNTNPTLSLPRKIIELHRSVRPDLYRSILRKLTSESTVFS